MAKQTLLIGIEQGMNIEQLREALPSYELIMVSGLRYSTVLPPLPGEEWTRVMEELKQQ